MKYPLQLSPGHQSEAVNVSWPAVAVTVLNPTAYTIVVNSGGNTVPGSLAAASWWCPPASMVTYPASGSAFAFGLLAGAASLDKPPANYPDTAFITVVGPAEQLPDYGSMALGIAPPSAVVLNSAVANAGGTYTDTINVGAGVRAAVLRPYYGMQTLRVTGATSGYIYLDVPDLAYWFPSGVGSRPGPAFTLLLNPELDSAILVNYSNIGLPFPRNTYDLTGYLERLPEAATRYDKRLYVEPVPPGYQALPVQDGGPSPSAYNSAFVVNPIASQQCVSITIPSSGLWRIDAQITTTQPGGPTGWAYLWINHSPPLRFTVASPGHLNISQELALMAGAQAGISQSDWSAATGNSIVGGTVLAYKLRPPL